ncbi:MAG: carboxylesterase family protein [Sandaracinaceae bacterium]|nr:carboxylesterase family protein [Sandaracinaceae bacterium]
MRTLASVTLATALASTSIACDGATPHDAGPEPGVDAATDAGLDAGIAAPVTVTTTAGDVLGVERDGVAVFRSIPYAAPPVGTRRFARPAPHPGWSDVLDTTATDATLACPQVDRMTGGFRGEEDCLVLSVFAPARAAGAPVMVFIHGGGFTGGSGNEPLYDGRSLAARGVVVVTLNYRLGVLGFLALDALVEDDGGAGMLGLYDQRLALAWVRDNAAAFGGDPANITIFGESAGAVSVMMQMVSPGSRGLFQRVIVQSGGGGWGYDAQDAAIARYAPVLTALGCEGAPDVVACLRAADDVEAITRAMDAAGTSALGLPNVGPHVDGAFLPSTPYALVADGTADVPFFVGSNADEATVFTRTIPVPTMAAFRAILGSVYDEATADAVVAIYDADRFGTAKAAFDKFFGEVGFVCPALAFAAAGAGGEPVYAYHFTRVLPGVAGTLGAFHGLELAFVFGQPGISAAYVPNDDDWALVETMQRAWVGYATSGVPVFAPGLSRYDPAAPSLAIFDEPPAQADAIAGGRCAALAELGLGVAP